MSNIILHRNHVVMPADPRLDALIPHAKRMQHDGKEFVVVPHTLDETKVLRNLGYDVAPPILSNYDWCGTTPFDAQRITAALITMNPQCFVLNAIGTGKTRSVLYAYEYMRRLGVVRRLLVTAPLSTLRQTWEREVFTTMPHLSVGVLFGTKAKRLEVLSQNHDIFVINHDGLRVIFDDLMKRTDIDMLALDELSVYKDAQTERWKITNKLARRMPRVVGVGATVIPKEASDCYGMVKLVSPTRVATSFTRFRETVMRKITDFKWVNREDALTTVHKVMQPSVRFTRDECYDLPECQYITREAKLSVEQAHLYKEVAGQCAAEVAAGNIKASNEADRINKLLQISLGTVYTTDRQVVTLDCKERLAVVEELCEQSNSKVIVFTPYKASLRMLAEQLGKRWTVATISGDTAPTERESIFSHFRNTADPHVIVAHPGTMSHGLTLTAASTIVWYGPPQSLEMYEQANGRITRAGQRHAQLIAHIAATPLEARIYHRLETRSTVQGVLLEMFENQDLGDVL